MKTAKEYKKGEVIKDWQQDGVRCLILRGPASFCCYLGVPSGHPLADFGYDDIPLDCHGGLTFGSEAKNEGTSFPLGWYFYGWDYAHAGDRSVYDDYDFETGKSWTDDDVEEELKDVLWNFIRLVRLSEKIKNK